MDPNTTTHYAAVDAEGYSQGLGNTPEEAMAEADEYTGKAGGYRPLRVSAETAEALVQTMGAVRLVVEGDTARAPQSWTADGVAVL